MAPQRHNPLGGMIVTSFTGPLAVAVVRAVAHGLPVWLQALLVVGAILAVVGFYHFVIEAPSGDAKPSPSPVEPWRDEFGRTREDLERWPLEARMWARFSRPD